MSSERNAMLLRCLDKLETLTHRRVTYLNNGMPSTQQEVEKQAHILVGIMMALNCLKEIQYEPEDRSEPETKEVFHPFSTTTLRAALHGHEHKLVILEDQQDNRYELQSVWSTEDRGRPCFILKAGKLLSREV